MKPTYVIGIIILSSILTGCQTENGGLVREVSLLEPPTSENLSTLIESYEIIQLDRTPEAYISNPARTIYSDSLVLIKNESNQSIVVFNKEGKYLNTVSKRGRGPNEYLYINDFTFDPIDNTIDIYDGEKVKKFDFNGNYISERNLGFSPRNVTYLDPEHSIIEKVMPTGDSISDFYIRLVDQNFGTIYARNPVKPLSGPGFGIEGQTRRTSLNGDHAFFYANTGDTVYHIDQKSIKPVIAFKFQRKIITITDGTGKYDFDPNEALRYLSFFEVGDLNLLFYNFKKEGYCFAFNSSNDNAKLFKTTFSIRDVYNDRANILTDAMYLEQFIESNDPDMEKCINKDVLDTILADSIKDFQCLVKIKFNAL